MNYFSASRLTVLCLLLFCLPVTAVAAERARDLGIPFEGRPGPLNAITDVAGVTVGQTTIILDFEGGKAARTGVTAVVPRGRDSLDLPVFAGVFALNGNGEMTGSVWVEESGMLEGPVMLTNTHSVGVVRDATIRWRVNQGEADSSGYWWSLPMVAETWDGGLNDINGFHVTEKHVFDALETASDGAVAEGSVGAGTGTECHDFKCGIGTASRVADTGDGVYTVGVLVQSNYGTRETLMIGGLPVGRLLAEEQSAALPPPRREHSSIIAVVATDAPLLPHQLKRIARRVALGLARVGGIATNGSGDIFVAFSTANKGANQAAAGMQVGTLANENMSPLFEATVDATEEAIINSIIAGRDMTGHLGYTIEGIDHDAVIDILRRHGRLQP